MAIERDLLRDWHRLFGLLLTDFFANSPFTVEVERDLSQQQQFLDVVILRRGRGRFHGRLPDGLDDLGEHNLITFKSLREALNAWAMKELVGHSVAYRKLISPSTTDLLPEDQFRLYAVCARFPQTLAGQVPWRQRQAGVYDCQWGTDVVRVIVAGQLPQEPHNAPLHLFSASQALVDFGRGAYPKRSEKTSLLLGQLFERIHGEGFAMSYTMDDFVRDYVKEHFPRLPVAEQDEVLQSLPPETRQKMVASLPPEARRKIMESLPLDERLAGLSPKQIKQYLDRLSADRPTEPRKPRRKR